ncbi:MAG: hypothetical protein COB05_09815 [Marinobacter sp.]|nr:MAG: hypothetical protein COB05_09815 [Marinobacter sp.]
MSIQSEKAPQSDLLKAYREEVFSFDALLAAAGPDFGALVEVSPEIAIRLVEAFGGTDLWIPKDAAKQSRIREVLNESDAQKVIRIYECCRLKVPTLRRLKLAIRARKIVSLREKGWKLAELARHFQLTDRQILKILKDSRERGLA